MNRPSDVHAAALAPGFVEDVIGAGFELPTAIAFLPDGRLLVAEKSGVVWVIKQGAVLPTPFVDLRARVNDYWDRGLIGMAVDPGFASNGRVYFFYTYEHNAADASGSKTARLTRVVANGDRGGAETVLMGTITGAGCASIDRRCIPQDWYGHGSGGIQFAPDGRLLLALGDSASWNVVDDRALRAHDIDQYPGKILRVSSDGAGLPDNPFYDGDPGSIRSKVWAYGLRNPFRFHVRPGTNNVVYVGDPGWNNWEEIDVATRGANLGWPCFEGPVRQAGYESKPPCQTLYTQGAAKAPLISWAHNGRTAAAVGGPFSPPGNTFPAQYQNGFFFADYALQWIRFTQVDASDRVLGQPITLATDADGPVQLEFGPDKALYYVAIVSGEIRRISYAGLPPLHGTIDLSDLPENAGAVNGWGPFERNMSNGESSAGDGVPLTIGGQVFGLGLGAHALSDVTFDLSRGTCSTFTAQVGVDDEVGTRGSVVFQVWNGTSAKLYDSGIRRGSDGPVAVSLNISGVRTLRLVVTDAGDGFAYDHADWALARVTCSASDTSPPVISAITAVPGNTSASISWQTNEAADSQVEYGTTLSYGSFSTLDSARVTNHTQTVGGLAAGTRYNYRVRSRDAAGNLAVSGNQTFTTSAGGGSSFVSDMTPVATPVNGWGPIERDRSNNEQPAGDGRPLTIGGTVFSKGLGVHARSEVAYDLVGNCSTFTAQVGVDDEVGTFGSVVFQVWNNTATKLFDSGVRRGSDSALPVSVAIGGVTRLRLVVTDAGDGVNHDHADWADARVTCAGGNAPPTPVIESPSTSARYRVGDTIALSGSASDAEDGPIPAANLRWNITIEHCPGGTCHMHPFEQFTGASASFVAPDHGSDTFLRIVLTATDSAGASGSVARDLLPMLVPLQINTSPPGLQIVVDSTVVTTPYQADAIVNSQHTVEAPSPQGSYTFARWSDGGAQQHLIQIGATGATLTATFTQSGGSTRFLSDLSPVGTPTNGWGPIEKDRSNGENAAGDGAALTIGGQTFAKGLGVHAQSGVTYAVPAGCRTLNANVGIDDEVGTLGSVIFQVWNGTTTKLYESGLRRGTDTPLPIAVNLTGVTQLRLVVTGGSDGIDHDHADWANAAFACD